MAGFLQSPVRLIITFLTRNWQYHCLFETEWISYYHLQRQKYTLYEEYLQNTEPKCQSMPGKICVRVNNQNTFISRMKVFMFKSAGQSVPESCGDTIRVNQAFLCLCQKKNELLISHTWFIECLWMFDWLCDLKKNKEYKSSLHTEPHQLSTCCALMWIT